MAVKEYSLSADGEKQIARNFKAKEFASPDGSDKILIDDELLAACQKLRDRFGVPVNIISAYHSPEYAATVPSEGPDPQHTTGKAADIWVGTTRADGSREHMVSPRVLYRDLDRGSALGGSTYAYPWSGGLGRYPNHIHIDTRGYPARWG